MPYVRRYLITLGVLLAIAAGVKILVGFPTWAVAAVLLMGWPLGGTLITIDDDLPGGWSNPDGTSVPEWKMLWWWADILLVRGALVLLVFATEEAVAGNFALMAVISAAAMAALGVPTFLRGVRKELVNAG